MSEERTPTTRGTAEEIHITLAPVRLDLLTYYRLLTGNPLFGEVIGGRLDGQQFDVAEVVVDERIAELQPRF